MLAGRQHHHKGKHDFASTLKIVETFLATNEHSSRSARLMTASALQTSHLDASQSTSNSNGTAQPQTNKNSSLRNLSVPPTPDTRSLIEDTARTELLRLNLSELRPSVIRLLENSYYIYF